MAKAVYWQRGESLDYVNKTTEIIEANTIIPIEGRIGIAGTSINPNERGSLHVTGVYEMEKTGKTEILQGAPVYFDGTGITDVESDNTPAESDDTSAEPGNIPAGYAAQTAAAGDKTILVKLLG